MCISESLQCVATDASKIYNCILYIPVAETLLHCQCLRCAASIYIHMHTILRSSFTEVCVYAWGGYVPFNASSTLQRKRHWIYISLPHFAIYRHAHNVYISPMEQHLIDFSFFLVGAVGDCVYTYIYVLENVYYICGLRFLSFQ